MLLYFTCATFTDRATNSSSYITSHFKQVIRLTFFVQPLSHLLATDSTNSQSPRKMASSACEQVLGGVPELLENVLLQLPSRDLLLAQKVSKIFRDNIKASTR